jgi:hypothetical protein
MSNDITVVAFDYTALPPSAIEPLRAAAKRIREILHKNVIDIGRELINVKKILPRHFTEWLASEFEMTERTAENYMNAAKLAESRPEIILALKPTALYMLAAPSVPETAREAVFQRVAAGESLSVKDMRDVVASAKEEQKLEAARAELSPEQKKRQAAAEECRKREWENHRREQQRRDEEAKEALNKIVAILRNCLASRLAEMVGLLQGEAAPFSLGELGHELVTPTEGELRDQHAAETRATEEKWKRSPVVDAARARTP